jgi:hypothetical protein
MARFPPERLKRVCEAIKDRYPYVASISDMLSGVALAVLAGSAVPSLPTIDQICRGVQTALEAHHRATLLRDQCSVPLAFLSRRSVSQKEILDDASVLDRKVHSMLRGTNKCGPSVSLWPAVLHHELQTQQHSTSASTHPNTATKATLHMLPVLYEYRWILFVIDSQHSSVKLLDFLAGSNDYEMSLFPVRMLK